MIQNQFVAGRTKKVVLNYLVKFDFKALCKENKETIFCWFSSHVEEVHDVAPFLLSELQPRTIIHNKNKPKKDIFHA